MESAPAGFLDRSRFEELFSVLQTQGYRCIGPQARDGAIVYGPIEGPGDLPAGIGDRQEPGTYRLETGPGERFFAWANGPQALKPLVFSPAEPLWESRIEPDGRFHLSPSQTEPPRLAVIGVRACDLAALDLMDRHFGKGPFPDPSYAARRRNLFLVVVHCTHPASTCFCASTGDGPEAVAGYDLALGELDSGFIVSAGSETGRAIASRLPLGSLEPGMLKVQREQTERAISIQTRSLPPGSLRDPLASRQTHPHWKNIADRCLSCGNCTSVCPTCFCFGEREEPALDGHSSLHVREWDSCFTPGHSYIHPAPLREQTRFRYRQWLTHKLGYWHDQYGRSGCVGCGRCISWCPVGIDFTQDIPLLLSGPGDER
jgi:ferredoxin